MSKLTCAEAEYRALDRISYTYIKPLAEFNECDAYMKFLKSLAEPFKGSDATELGTAIHNILQGQRNKVKFIPWIDGTKQRAAKQIQKDEIAVMKLQDSELSFIDEREKSFIDKIEANFHANKDVKSILKTLQGIETAYIGDYGRHRIKGKLDFDLSNGIVDIKTTSGKNGGDGLSVYEMRNTIDRSHYDLQAAIYSLLKGSNEYWIIFVSTTSGQVRPVKLSEEVMQRGKDKLKLAFERYDKYLMNQHLNYYSTLEI